jgi:AcrR family transcriptional regulator
VQVATQTDPTAEPRTPLSKERVLRAAVDLADKGGIDSLSMRKLAQELGVEAMSLYNHVRNKEDILNGIVDVVVGEIEIPPQTSDWKTSLRQTVMSARAVLLRHPWAPRVIETRTNPSPATFQYFDSVIGILRTGGFSVDMAHHALHALGSRVLGFTQELFNDSDELASGPEAAAMFAQMADKYPHMIEMAMAVSHEGGLGGCDDDKEFAFALDLLLEGLERYRDAGATPAGLTPGVGGNP